MTDPEPSIDDMVRLWLGTALLVRTGGRTLDLDAIAAQDWAGSILPLASPITLVTAWNPRGRPTEGSANRAANRQLRARLEVLGLVWRPALGRGRDGTWAEPGFAVGGLSEAQAAALGSDWDQLAVFVVTNDEVVVLASDRSLRRSRPRWGAGGAG